MASNNPQRWARGLPHLLWKRPGLPRDWVRVLDQHAEGEVALPAPMWIVANGLWPWGYAER
jgi:hypothetical protein